MEPNEFLEIPLGSSRKAIREAFTKKALEHHPDKGGNPATFKQAYEAYTALLRAVDYSDIRATLYVTMEELYYGLDTSVTINDIAIDVSIPPGTIPPITLKYASNEQHGTIYVDIDMVDTPATWLDGADICMLVDIPIMSIALRDTIAIKTISGEIIQIPAEHFVQNTYKVIEKHGMRIFSTGQCGDLFVHGTIVNTTLTDPQISKMREIVNI